jgi:hypothetical protein
LSGTTDAASFGLSGTLTLSALDYNSAALGFERLDWTRAFDLDGDGSADVLDPGSQLSVAVELPIDFDSSLQFALSGGIENLVVEAGPVSVSGDAQIALSRHTVDVDTDGDGTAELIGATLDELALSIGVADTPVTVDVTGVGTLTLTGKLALARVTAAGESTARYTALKLADVSLSGTTDAASFGLSGTLTLSALDYNSAALGFERLDWTRAFDLDGDGSADVLDPGSQLSVAVELPIDFDSSLQFALSGGIENLVVEAGPVSVSGDAQIALSRHTVDVDTDGDGTAELIGATLDELALSIGVADTPVTVDVTGVGTLTLTGKLALARVTAAGESTARYTALKLADVSLSGTTDAASFGLSGTLTLSALDYNSAALGFERLDWTRAFDLDGDGSADVLDPGSQLSVAVELPIDFDSSLQFALSGGIENLVVEAGPVSVSGDAQIALSRHTVDVDTDGDGTAELIGATLDELALSIGVADTPVTVDVTGVGTLTLTGKLALASVTAAGESTARYTALKLADVSLSGTTDAASFGLSGTLTLSALDYNSAALGFERLDWTRAFDLDGDGSADVLDPGSQLSVAVELPIDFDSSLQFALSARSRRGPLHLRPGLPTLPRQRTSRSTT